MNKRIKLYSSILLLGLMTSCVLGDINFDHTKGECIITKTLNLIPVGDDEVPYGTALHQYLMMYHELKAKGLNPALFDYPGKDIEICDDGVIETKVNFKKNK